VWGVAPLHGWAGSRLPVLVNLRADVSRLGPSGLLGVVLRSVSGLLPEAGTNVRAVEGRALVKRGLPGNRLDNLLTPLDDGLLGTRFDEERSETR